MSRPVVPAIGHCPCRHRGCEETAEVKRCKNHETGALFLNCPVSGIDRANSQIAQSSLDAYINKNVTWIKAVQEPGLAPDPEPEVIVQEPGLAPDPAPEPIVQEPGQETGMNFLGLKIGG